MLESLGFIGLGFIGGIILNLMPCVLPVLMLKVYHLISTAQASSDDKLRSALGYTLGTTSLLAALGGLVVVLRASGRVLGWGMQFQNPVFIAVMTAIIVAFALNALGVFEIALATSRDGGESFFGNVVRGWLAAIMSTPCSAPFVGTAVVFALSSDTPAAVTVATFASIGLGLAFPLIAITVVPALGRLLPRPGAWMEHFKKIMGFTLLATAVWLYSVLQAQITPASASAFLAFLVAMAFALWLLGSFAGPAASSLQRGMVRAGAVVLLLAAGQWLSFTRSSSGATLAAATKAGEVSWQPYSKAVVDAAAKDGKAVFYDFTADWCAACKVNEKTVLSTDAVVRELTDAQVVAVKVDMTNENDEHDALLKSMGRNAIPVYATLLPNGTLDVLPVAITPQMVTDAVQRARSALVTSK